jgi:hypothetical protein
MASKATPLIVLVWLLPVYCAWALAASRTPATIGRKSFTFIAMSSLEVTHTGLSERQHGDVVGDVILDKGRIDRADHADKMDRVFSG